jgi:hypothetical protein
MKIFEIMIFFVAAFRHAGGGRYSMTSVPLALYQHGS